ncbi:MAG: mechanosensitive ion channel family protein [Eubacteriales bacterium]|jgi:small conductance mechanosensitive channel
MQDIQNYSTFWERLWQTVKTVGATSIFKILLAVAILIVGSKSIKLLLRLLNKSRGYTGLDESVRSFLNSFIRVVLYAVLYITAATALGVPETSLVTALASCGLAVGLALQGSLSNFAGGIMILIFKPFKIGDYIVSGEFEGTVREINVLYTVIITIDNCKVTIPNGSISNAPVTDVTGLPTRRMDIPVGIAYAADIDKALSALLGVAADENNVLKSPIPEAMVDSLGDSSVNLILRVWVATENYWDVRYRLTKHVKETFDRNGIEIPFPQMDVHVEK